MLCFGSRVDRVILKLLFKVFPRGSLLEAGANSGHLSYRLAQLGYFVTLVDILDGPIREAQLKFEKANLAGDFIVSDIRELNGSWDGVWNTGVVQCYSDHEREKLVEATCRLAPRALFIYPDVSHPKFPKEYDFSVSPGVAGCVEYENVDLIPVMSKFYKEIHSGELQSEKLGLPYSMKYVWGKN